ncbi:hypothetical protein BDW02DRAFT_518218 [Decorospora gaudefroyi]|uniref:Uncharacterized protein n=1 Tax=Decorospora gaudefroyi TaxID=184978 RepID=A0A6A5KTE0_9PLEO|nr:hypothetical protein BDW02DRAFT_518218 [Decorospora gaudefroyi]
MSFNLDALYCEPVEVGHEHVPYRVTREDAVKNMLSGELWMAEADSEEVIAKDREEAGLRGMIAALTRERDAWEAQAKAQAKVIADLDRHISKEVAHSGLPDDIIRHLNRLESEIARLRCENNQLKENLRATECENVSLGNQIEGKARKLKGATKKVKNAKEVADKEEEKAKDAMGDKQRHLASERKMKKERNDALAALQEQKKISADLRAELEVEQLGTSHMRDAVMDSNNTVAVLPIEFEIRREDFQPIMTILEVNRMKITENFTTWYDEWKKPVDEVRKVVGADYLNDEKKKKDKKEAKIYEDMIDMPDSCMETGAEHDGWRSKRALVGVCRQAEARYNGEG